MNPKLFPPIDGLEAVVHLIERCYERFVDLWPEAKQVHEIRELAASLIARMAIQCAYRSPVKMSRWYLESARYHLPTFARGAVRFAAVSGLALWRQNRFTEHSK
jgi:hypothetical protein